MPNCPSEAEALGGQRTCWPGRRLAGWLTFAFVLAFLASLPNRFAHLDDAWLGEQAFWAWREGAVRSELFRGFLGYEERIWAYHKGFIWIGAGALWLGGWSLSVLKAVSLPWFVALLVLFVRHLRRQRERFGEHAVRLAPLLLLAHPRMVEFAYTFRPEMALATCALATFVWLDRYLESGRRASLFAAALATGVGVLLHLNGVVFIAAGVGLLVVERRGRAALVFGAIATALGAFYFADVAVAGEWREWARQFAADPALEARDFSVLGALEKLAMEWRRWFRHGEDVATSVLVIVSAVLLGHRLRGSLGRPALFTLIALIALGLVAQSKTTKYALPLLPVAMLVVAGAMGQARRARALLALLFWGFLIVGASRSVGYFTRNAPTAPRHAAIVAPCELEAGLVADLTFAFDELPERSLQGIWGYRVAAEAAGVEFDLPSLVEAARADGQRYLALDERRDLPRRLAREWRSEGLEGVSEVPLEIPGALLLDLSPPSPKSAPR